ncbi:hypothetical protein [Trueperella sp. LYQ143]|uniref:hypothetical protein n=1 Tax=Trueperella sp. LYQ143 TaxID=3391059 RepID=UPI003983833F
MMLTELADNADGTSIRLPKVGKGVAEDKSAQDTDPTSHAMDMLTENELNAMTCGFWRMRAER